MNCVLVDFDFLSAWCDVLIYINGMLQLVVEGGV